MPASLSSRPSLDVQSAIRRLAVVTVAVLALSAAVPAAMHRLRSATHDPVAGALVGLEHEPEGLGEIDRLIAATTASTTKTPTSSGLDLLAQLHLSRGRITGDAASYAAATDASRRSLAIAPRSIDSLLVNAEVRYSNHDFLGAASIANDVLRRRPGSVGALAIAADAAREVGDDRTARELVDRVARIAPSAPASLVRRARNAWLDGNLDRAKAQAGAAERAAAVSGLAGTTESFFSSFSAQLAFDTGDIQGSQDGFTRALRLAPGDRVATVGLARTLAAAGRPDDAASLLRSLTDRVPDLSALTLLGDILARDGKTTDAENAYALVDAIAKIARSNQQIYNRELARFALDRRLDRPQRLREALSMARSEIAVRKDVHGWDTLAWAEYRNGNFDAASDASAEALRLGKTDAAMRFHAGMIALALGERGSAREHLGAALTINPHFDVLQADVARTALNSLGDAR